MQSAQYLVVLEVLNRTHGRDRDRLYRALRRHERADIDEAISSLEKAGVVTVSGRTVRAAQALVRLEQLNLIAV
jgi:hypothetical protein